MTGGKNFKSGYSAVNGLAMYYEIYREGKPLVMLHGGGSDIKFHSAELFRNLPKADKFIAMDLHGRTNDKESALTFKQDADDVAQLLKNLGITKAVF